jgi:hypothetical protein
LTETVTDLVTQIVIAVVAYRCCAQSSAFSGLISSFSHCVAFGTGLDRTHNDNRALRLSTRQSR